MTKHQRSALAVSISLIIFFTLSLFLYSCGVSSPTGSSHAGNSTQTTTPSTPAPILLTASSTYNTISITMTGMPGKIYHLYMADNPQAQASTSTPLPDNNIHNLTLDPSKTYYFILGEVGSDGKEHFSGAYITSKPPIGSNARENIVVNPPSNNTQTKQISGKNNTTANNNSGINGLLGLNPYLKLTGGGRLNVVYETWNYNSGFTALHVAEPSGGHFVENNWFFANVLGREGGHPEVTGCIDTNGKPVSDCWGFIYRWHDPSSPVAGYWDDYDNRYRNSHANGTFTISFLYDTAPEPYFSFFGQPYITFRVNVCNKKEAEGIITLKAATDWMDFEHITPSISVNAPGSCPGDDPSPPPVNKKLAKIDITPTGLTTIYIHPKKPDAGKPDHGSQQYTAMGIFEGESVPVDVTKTGDVIWHSSKPEIATMSTKQGEEGLFIPVTTPKITLGTTDIQATSAVPAAPADIKSNIAHLCVECWEYTHYRQNAQNRFPNDCWWSDDPYARNWDPIYKKDKNGNIIIDKKTKQPIIIDWKDLGPRYRDQVTGKVVKQIQNSKGIWIDPTIGAVGCHMTSAAMVLTATTEESVDPRLLNNWLNGHNGYSTFNGPLWKVVQQYPNSKIIYATDEQAMVDNAVGRTWDDSIKNIKGALQNCDMVVLTVTGDLAHHYVLLIKENNGSYKIRDPWLFNSDKTIASLDDLSTHYRITHYNIILIFKI